MPGQRRSAGPRPRESWLPTLAGLGVVVLLAAGAATAYLLAFHPGSAHHPRALPTKVLSYQTVGLVTQASGTGGSPGQFAQLLGAGGAAQFAVLAQNQVQQGTPQWTADQMAGGTYIFIYLKTGQCLAATGTARKQSVTLQHCDLLAEQRWRPTGVGGVSGGHAFRQFANLGDGACLTRAGPQQDTVYGASLTSCRATAAASQLIAFWWSSV
jgi:hypothetical protein